MRDLDQQPATPCLATRLLTVVSGLAMATILTLAIVDGRHGHGHPAPGEVVHHSHFFLGDHAHPEPQRPDLPPASAASGSRDPDSPASDPKTPDSERPSPAISIALTWLLPDRGPDLSGGLALIALLLPGARAPAVCRRGFESASPRGPPA